MQKIKENLKQSAIIFLKEWRLVSLHWHSMLLDEEDLVFSTSIFDSFDEVKIKRDGNWLFRSLSLGPLGHKIIMISPEKWYATTFIFIEIDLQKL